MACLAPTILLTAALFAATGDAAFDRPQTSGLQMPYQLEIVDPGMADISPLSTSLRQLDHGLAIPTDFEHVYRLPGDRDRFVRADGALFAVFPQSEYAPTRFGDVPLIPANTVFYIGAPPAPNGDFPFHSRLRLYPSQVGEQRSLSPLMESWKLNLRIEPRRAERSGQWIDGSVGHTIAPVGEVSQRISPTVPIREESAVAPGTIIGDERYRSERIGTLMRRAADAARDPK